METYQDCNEELRSIVEQLERQGEEQESVIRSASEQLNSLKAQLDFKEMQLE